MPETRYAILIGNTDYPADPKLGKLRLPAQDVAGLAEVLWAPQIGQFPKENVKTLINQSHDAIVKETLSLLKKASSNDLVLIYFSGHGKLAQSGKLYLATADTQSDLLEATAVPMDTIKDFIDDARSTRIVIVLDCCFSGAAGNSIVKGNVDDALILLSGGRGKYILTASTGHQTAQEKPDDQYSVFTKYLIEGLQTGEADVDQKGHITVDEWYQYAYSKVTRDNHQEPMKWVTDVKGELVLARNPFPRTLPAPLQIINKIKMDSARLGRELKEGKVIPFLGQGVLLDSHPHANLGLETLAAQLAQPFNLPTHSLNVVAQSVVMAQGRGVLYQLLKDQIYQSVIPLQPTSTHRFFANISRPLLFFSAAYDNLLEQAFNDVGKRYVVVTHLLHTDNHADRGKVMVQYSDKPNQVDLLRSADLVIDMENWSVIYKIQGAFELDQYREGETDSLVISEEDYLSMLTLLENPETTIPNCFVRYFPKRTFLFLGYSLIDWNNRALIDLLFRKAKDFKHFKPYAVCETVTEDFERQYWDYKNVNIIETKVSTFIADMAAGLGIKL